MVLIVRALLIALLTTDGLFYTSLVYGEQDSHSQVQELDIVTTRLNQAISSHDLTALETLLTVEEVDVNRCLLSETECLHPLLIALEQSNLPAFKLLLENGADANGATAEPNDNASPLMMATYVNNREAATLLIKHGADVNHVATDMSPLAAAAFLGRPWFVATLLRNGADVSQTSRGETIEDLARKAGHHYLAQQLSQPESWLQELEKQLVSGVKNHQLWEVQSALALGADPSMMVDGLALISMVLDSGRIDIADALKEAGVNLESVDTDNNTPLMRTINSENTVGTQWLIENGANLNPESEYPLLVLAMYGEQDSVIQLLLQHGVDTVDRGTSGILPLEMALATLNHDLSLQLIAYSKDTDFSSDRVIALANALGSDIEHVLELLRQVRDRLSVNTDQLLLAAKQGDENAWRSALAHGVIIDARDDENFTALHRAAYQGDHELVSALLKYSPTLTLEVEGYTALMLSVLSADSKTIYYLLNAGADRHLVGGMGKSAFQLAKDNNTRVAEILFADTSRYEELAQNQAFLHSVINNEQASFQQYLQQDIDINWHQGDGFTALAFAARDGRTDIAKALISNGANLESPIGRGWSPLLLAAKNNNTSVLVALIAEEVDVHDKSPEGKTALDYAKENRATFAHKLLITEPEDRQSLLDGYALAQALINNDAPTAYQLIKQGANLNLSDDLNWQPIHFAVRERQNNLLGLILRHDVELDQLASTTEGMFTPLMVAVFNDNLLAAYKLLEAGASTEIENERGETALALAKRLNIVDLVELLRAQEQDRAATFDRLRLHRHYFSVIGQILDSNDPDIQTNLIGQVEDLMVQESLVHVENVYGWTLLQLAARDGNDPLVKLALEHGADADKVVNTTDSPPKSALELAIWNDELEITHRLLKATQKPILRERALEIAREKQFDDIILLLNNPENYQRLQVNRRVFEIVWKLRSSKRRLQPLVEELDGLLSTGLVNRSNIDSHGMLAGFYLLLSKYNYEDTLVKLLPEQPVTLEIKDADTGHYFNPLMMAVSNGHLSEVRALLNIGYQANASTASGHSALGLAIEEAKYDMVSLLQSQPSERASLINTLELFKAIEKGRGERVQSLLTEGGLLPDLLSAKGWSAIHYFAANGDLRNVQRMYALGAEIGAKSRGGETPLMLAANASHHRVMEWLLYQGASATYANEQGETAQDYAVANDDLYAYLLLSQTTNESGTPLSENAFRLTSSVKSQDYLSAQKQLELLSSTNNQLLMQLSHWPYPTRSPLHYAALVGDSLMIELLVKHGFSPNLRDSQGVTALMLAAQVSLEVVDVLQKHGAISKLGDNQGLTAVDFLWDSSLSSEDKELIDDKLWLPITLKETSLNAAIRNLIERGYELEGFEADSASLDIVELSKVSIEYAHLTAFQWLHSHGNEPLLPEQTLELIVYAVKILQNPEEFVELLLEQQPLALSADMGEKLQSSLAQVCLRNPMFCLQTLPSEMLTAIATQLEGELDEANVPNLATCETLSTRVPSAIEKVTTENASRLGLEVTSRCQKTYPTSVLNEVNLVVGIGHQSSISALDVQEVSNGWVASGDVSGKVIVWEKQTQKLVNEWIWSGGRVNYLKFHNTQPWLIVASNKEVLVWDLLTQQVRWQVEIINQSVLLSNNRIWVADGSDIVELSADSGQVHNRWKSGGNIRQLLTVDNQLLSIHNHLIALWSRDGELLQTYLSEQPLVKVVSSSDGSTQIMLTDSTIGEGFQLHRLVIDPNLSMVAIKAVESLNDEVSNLSFATSKGGDMVVNCRGELKWIAIEENPLIAPSDCSSVTGHVDTGPLVALESEHGQQEFWVANQKRIQLIHDIDSEPHATFVGNSQRKIKLCSLKENTLYIDSPLGRRGIDLRDRGLPAVLPELKKGESWLCANSQTQQFSQSENGEIQRYERSGQSLVTRYYGLSSLSTKHVFDSENHNKVVVIGTKIGEGYDGVDNHIAVFDRQNHYLIDAFTAFPESSNRASRFLSMGTLLGVQKSMLSPNGRWLALFNEQELVVYDLEKNIITSRTTIEGSDIQVDNEYVYVLNSDLYLLPLNTLWHQPQKIALTLTSTIGDEVAYAPLSSQREKFVLFDNRQIIVSLDNQLYRFDVDTGKGVRLKGHHEDDIWELAATSSSKLVTLSADATFGVWDIYQGMQARIVGFADGSWAAVNDTGLFDASVGGMEKLYFRVGSTLLDIEQLKDRYFEPYLLQKVLGIHQERIRDAGQLKHVALYPKAQIEEVEVGVFEVTLVDQGGGIGELTVYLNNKYVSLNEGNSRNERLSNGQKWTIDLADHAYLKPGDNQLSVVATNKEGYLSSRGINVQFVSNNKKPQAQPRLFIVSIGVSDYQGTQLDLRFSAKDAKDMEQALVRGAQTLFGTPHTKSWLLTTDATSEELLPTKRNVQRIFEQLSRESTSSDILVLYLSGHGITMQANESEYYFLTQDAYSTDINTYKDPALLYTTTLSSSEIIQLANQTSILKQVLILDTCASGQVVENLAQTRDLSSDALRALEKVQNRTGMHVITGSTADAVSYEASQFGQGILTYSLLEGMKGAALEQGSFVDVVTLFSRARDRVPELAKNIGGIQQPVVFSKADSFYIGQLDEDARRDINLLQPKPVFMRTTLMNKETLRDDLLFGRQLEAHLREESLRGRGSELVFVESYQYASGIKVSGLYNLTAEGIRLEIAVFKEEVNIGRIELDISDNELNNWPNTLTRLILTEIEGR
ncbi:ankyrin repeat domain-containing protein [Vibrio aestuarianus]|uniref:Ankyrin repeat domain-containing protein n=1 Tax=Vibrio aestuarianus TaxID=28171 RepID=A0AAX3UB50_9VIBR|nr:ankyrin repeat domain-containing protein [Vibrio aestuarianus]WGK84005.1 ankyrin repeat domain-containing protein [Vibrio aestuarianus]